MWNGDLWFDVDDDDGNNKNTKKYNDNHKDNQKEKQEGKLEDFFRICLAIMLRCYLGAFKIKIAESPLVEI